MTLYTTSKINIKEPPYLGGHTEEIGSLRVSPFQTSFTRSNGGIYSGLSNREWLLFQAILSVYRLTSVVKFCLEASTYLYYLKLDCLGSPTSCASLNGYGIVMLHTETLWFSASVLKDDGSILAVVVTFRCRRNAKGPSVHVEGPEVVEIIGSSPLQHAS